MGHRGRSCYCGKECVTEYLAFRGFPMCGDHGTLADYAFTPDEVCVWPQLQDVWMFTSLELTDNYSQEKRTFAIETTTFNPPTININSGYMWNPVWILIEWIEIGGQQRSGNCRINGNTITTRMGENLSGCGIEIKGDSFSVVSGSGYTWVLDGSPNMDYAWKLGYFDTDDYWEQISGDTPTLGGNSSCGGIHSFCTPDSSGGSFLYKKEIAKTYGIAYSFANYGYNLGTFGTFKILFGPEGADYFSVNLTTNTLTMELSVDGDISSWTGTPANIAFVQTVSLCISKHGDNYLVNGNVAIADTSSTYCRMNYRPLDLMVPASYWESSTQKVGFETSGELGVCNPQITCGCTSADYVPGWTDEEPPEVEIVFVETQNNLGGTFACQRTALETRNCYIGAGWLHSYNYYYSYPTFFWAVWLVGNADTDELTITALLTSWNGYNYWYGTGTFSSPFSNLTINRQSGSVNPPTSITVSLE
jgi:hypothetical protein